MSFAFGPFALSVGQLVFLLAFGMAFLVAFLGSRGKSSRADNTLVNALIFGFIIARLVFVVRYWPDYQSNLLSIVDIRDRGFVPLAGVVAAVVWMLIAGFRHRVQRVPLLISGFTGAFSWLFATILLYQHSAVLPDMPDYALTDLANASVELEQFRGQPIVINLWASWCGPCRREMPVISDAQHQYPDVHFLLINQGESPEVVQLFLHEESLELANVLLDPRSVMSNYWRVRGLPTTLFFDEKGQYSHHHFGELSAASLRHQLERLQ
ncbi:redoxin domain-containing protein [Methylophaga lonarensis MPL]|uniref:Redoxin domain-containing protein n=1 Tax=Methylophaga lonarensis MPL TaxID=1286106 RepID=M7NU35_9GAMM|nr:TlpA family protein disulfide reductase [Methylophaga lonarensis]EMR12258.1 redoxin domain-containing protein [Methylophaga lonarensis MPL]